MNIPRKRRYPRRPIIQTYPGHDWHIEVDSTAVSEWLANLPPRFSSPPWTTNLKPTISGPMIGWDEIRSGYKFFPPRTREDEVRIWNESQ